MADALIAATALANNMAVVTRDVGNFERFHPLKILNPSESAVTES